jgi:hypothetical protein
VAGGVVLPTLVIRRLHAFWQRGRFFRLMLRESPVTVAMLHIVRVMAFGADKPALGAGTGPFANPFAMDTLAPVPIDLTVTFAAQLLRLVETDRFVVMINQFVALSGMMTIQAPDVATTVRKFG